MCRLKPRAINYYKLYRIQGIYCTLLAIHIKGVAYVFLARIED